MENGIESPVVRLASDQWQVVYTLDGSRFNLLHDGRLWMAGGVVSLATDQWLLRPEVCGPGQARMEAFDGPMGTGRRLIITHGGLGAVQMTVRFALFDRYSGLSVELSVTNTGSKPLRIFGFNVLEVLGEKAGFWPGHGGTDGSVFKSGFHSRSVAVTLRAGETDIPAGGREGWLRYADPGTRPFKNKNHFISDWACALRAKSGGGRCAMAFISGARQLGHFFYRRPERAEDFLARSEAEGALVAQGESLDSETLYLTAGNEKDNLLGECFDAMGRTMGARIPSHPMALGCLAAGPRPDGEDLDRKLALWKALSAHASLDGVIVQTDPLGEDRALEDTCAASAGRIRDHGFKPGVRLAPMAVPDGSSIACEHPEWLIREDGKPSAAGTFRGRRLFGLDATHPQVQQHLRRQIRRLNQWGYEVIVLDLLNAATLPGEFYQPGATRIENLRRALEIFREEAPQSFLIGAWCPIGPAVGLLDAVEMGPIFEPPPRRQLFPLFGKRRAEGNTPSDMISNRAIMGGRLWSNAIHYELPGGGYADGGSWPAPSPGTVLFLSGPGEAVAGD